MDNQKFNEVWAGVDEETKTADLLAVNSFIEFVADIEAKIDKDSLQRFLRYADTTSESKLAYMYMGYLAGLNDGIELIDKIEQIAKAAS